MNSKRDIPNSRSPKRVELEDLIAFYPDVNDEKIQEKITLKKEFAELASSPLEKLEGRYFKHQLLIQRFLQAYDDLLLFHDTGTGKSRILDLIGEYFRTNSKCNLNGVCGKIEKALVLVRSDILKSEIESQIVKGCADGTYDVEEYFPSNRKRALRKKIETWYEIVSYQKFARDLQKKEDVTVRDLYSNTLIFFDEVHNIRVDNVHKKKSKRFVEEMRNKRMVYNQIYRVFHLPRNVKRIIATATPMINDVSEIGPLMNLILPKNLQFPADFPYDTATLEDYEPYFRGRLSYVRSLDTGINIQKIGIPVNEIPDYKYQEDFEPQIKVFPNYMSEFQNEAYLRASNPTGSKEKKKKTFYHAERQDANFVYPDGSWGSKGFSRFTEKIRNNYYPKPEFKEALSTIEGIRKMSVKIANMIEIAEKVENGNVYIYDNFVEASGAITIALCFQAMGYEIFNESQSVFRSKNPFNDAGDKEGFAKEIIPDFKKRKRVGLFTGLTSESTFSAMKELLNSYENRHGEYLKIFITSPTGSEGISLRNVVSIHICSGDWKYATPHQAKSRAIRSTSHEDLLIEKQQLYRELGLDPNSARVNVEVYYHVSISRSSPAQSIDAYLYTLAETKDRAIKRVQRFMKQLAIDSQIHYERNVRKTDKPGTMESDYVSLPRYKFHDQKLETIDYSTYDIYYMMEPIGIIIELLREYFLSHFSINLVSAARLLKTQHSIPPRNKYLCFAFAKIISTKVPFKDRYGYTCYLEKDGDTVFLSREYDREKFKRHSAKFYTENLIALQHVPLKSVKSDTQIEKQSEAIRHLKSVYKDKKELHDQILNHISIETSAQLLENAIYRSLYPSLSQNQTDTEFNNTLLDYFQLYNEEFNRKPSVYYSLHEPVTEIRKLKEELIKKEQGRGRKPKHGIRKVKSKHYKSESEYEWDQDTDLVFVHTLYTLQRTKTRYADKTRYFKANGRLRILKLNTSSITPSTLRATHSVRWRDATPEESVIYSLWIQSQLYHFKQQFEERSLVYGYYLGGNNLTIRNKIDEDPNAIEDKRKLKTGRVCSNITPPVLVKILEYLKVQPPKNIDENMCVQELLHYIVKTKGFQELEGEIEDYTCERLRYFASWILVSKSVMCKCIEDKLYEHDLLFRTL